MLQRVLIFDVMHCDSEVHTAPPPMPLVPIVLRGHDSYSSLGELYDMPLSLPVHINRRLRHPAVRADLVHTILGALMDTKRLLGRIR